MKRNDKTGRAHKNWAAKRMAKKDPSKGYGFIMAFLGRGI